jgi:hypothetical protein
LPAKRTGNGFANFHAQNLTALGQNAILLWTMQSAEIISAMT